MLAQWRWINRHAPSIPSQTRCISDHRPFQAGDLVLLREKLNRSAPPILTRPLKPGRQVQSHKGVIKHEDLIGQRVRGVVTPYTKRDVEPGKFKSEYRLHEVRLDEYIRLSKRLVTPVYPADARLIVELLDLHPVIDGSKDEKLEILEAGTGHGGLTLYLSRALHGSNPPLPNISSENEDDVHENWRKNRRAVIHSLDISEKYSRRARDVVKGFRHGLYYHNTDFHVAAVSEWLENKLVEYSGQPFLSHAILDLPNANSELAAVAKALRVDGTLVVFNPSITQITQCAIKVKEDSIPLELERVVELPTNGEAGGREWDVRAVRPKATSKPVEEESVSEGEDAIDENGDGERAGEAEEDVGRKEEVRGPETAKENEGWYTVCRPKVGDRIIGGGFLGVFKKQRPAISPAET